MKFLIFLQVLFFVETMSLEGTYVWICLMFTFAINMLEYMRARFSLLGFQLRQIDFVIHLAALPKLPIVLWLVRAIVFDIFGTLGPTRPSYVILLSAVFTLRNIWAHICSIDYHNKASNIKALVNKSSSLRTTLNIPDINPNDRYFRFRKDLDDS